MWTWALEVLGLTGHQRGEYYVYELVDPRFEKPKVFYVGKGKGARVYQHERDTRSFLKKGTPSAIMSMRPKHKRILEIWDDGREVQYRVIFRSNSQEEAFQVEAERIRFYGLERLTNETYGYNPIAVRKRRAALRARR